MNWIKKRYDQFLLSLVAVALLACAVLIYLKVQSFGENFATVVATVPPDNKVKPVPLDQIDHAKEILTQPPTWIPAKYDANHVASRGSLFVSERYILNAENNPEKPWAGSLYKDSLTGEAIPNRWFLENDLPLLDPMVATQDPDKDGFLNEDEWRAKTDPNKKESHPPYHTKLFLAQFVQIPFRLVFKSYDGDPAKDKPEKFQFQIDTIDLRQPSDFLKLGDTVPHTKFKLDKFVFKEAPNPKTGDKEDVSELTLVNIETNDKIVLIYNRITNSPDVYGLFAYEWMQPVQMIKVKKLGEFVLKPEVDDQHHYKLIDINETEAQIQLPDGTVYHVKPDPRPPAGK